MLLYFVLEKNDKTILKKVNYLYKNKYNIKYKEEKIKMQNDKTENFLDGIEMTQTDWDSIDTSKIPNDCDKTPVDNEFESCMADIPDDVERILDIVDIVEQHIKSRAKAFNEAVFKTLKKKAPYLVKLDDDVVY